MNENDIPTVPMGEPVADSDDGTGETPIYDDHGQIQGMT